MNINKKCFDILIILLFSLLIFNSCRLPDNGANESEVILQPITATSTEPKKDSKTDILAKASKAFTNGVNDKNWFYEDYSEFWGLVEIVIEYELYYHYENGEANYYLLSLSDTRILDSPAYIFCSLETYNGNFNNVVYLKYTRESIEELREELPKDSELIGTDSVEIPSVHKPYYNSTIEQKNMAVEALSQKFYTCFSVPDGTVYYICDFYDVSEYTMFMYEYEGEMWLISFAQVSGTLNKPTQLDRNFRLHANLIERIKECSIYTGYVNR